MNRLLFASIVATVSILLTGCSSDDTVTTEAPNSYCYISNITLGTLTRNVVQNETTTKTTYAGNIYPISIDQREKKIVNTTPLLKGTDLSIVRLTITAKGSVVFAPKSNQDSWYVYTSSAYGTIDFREPVIFRVYATDGSGYREYEMTLTVREDEVGSYTWEPLETDVLNGRKERKAVAWQDGLLLLSADAAGSLHKVTFENNAWSDDKTCTGVSNAQLATLQRFDSKLWMSTQDGRVLCSEDGESWGALTQSNNGDEITLMAASENNLYARVHNSGAETTDWIASSANGTDWTSCSLEQGKDISMFPTESASISYAPSDDKLYVIAAGKTPTGKTAVWKLDEKSQEPWVLMSQTGDSELVLPWKTGTQIVRDNNALFALNGSESATYVSYDNGIIWKKHTYLALPVTDDNFAASTLGGYIYIFAGSNVQRASINK